MQICTISFKGLFDMCKYVHDFLKDILACANECQKIGRISCCAFEWSETSGVCKLHQNCKNDQKRHRGFFTCRKEGESSYWLLIAFLLRGTEKPAWKIIPRNMKIMLNQPPFSSLRMFAGIWSYRWKCQRKWIQPNEECKPGEVRSNHRIFCFLFQRSHEKGHLWVNLIESVQRSFCFQVFYGLFEEQVLLLIWIQSRDKDV